MRSFDLKYSDILNDDDLPDRSCVFYITHPATCSTANIREYCSQWNLLSYDRLNLTTHIVGVSLRKDTVDTMLAKMRANDKNFIITPYAEYHCLDPSKIKIKEPSHLFDVDPSNRKSNKRVYVDKDAVASTQQATAIASAMEVAPEAIEKPILPKRTHDDLTVVDNKRSPTIEQLIEQREKARGVKKQKLFEYDDE
ncbi:unnamed protein product, partial [Rotaria magnacalcarata]